MTLCVGRTANRNRQLVRLAELRPSRTPSQREFSREIDRNHYIDRSARVTSRTRPISGEYHRGSPPMKRTRRNAPLGQEHTSREAHPEVAHRASDPRPSTQTRSTTTALATRIALTLALAFSPTISIADVTDDDATRRFSTGPKLVQIDNMNGVPREAAAAHAQVVDQPGLRESADRRSFAAGPTEPVCVGLIGCPGCMEILAVVRPVLVGRWGR